jgi:hypothetical protein
MTTTNLQAVGNLLTASRADRVLRYRLLPYGQVGRTNKGQLLASAGSVTIPAEPQKVNLEHDKTRPVGTMTATEDADGLLAEVQVANTRAGDDVLEEAEAGLRDGISVELDRPVVRNGRLVSGTLAGAGLVVDPAFPGAKQLTASVPDVGTLEDTTTTEGNTNLNTTTPPAAAPAFSPEQFSQLLAGMSGSAGAPADNGPDTSLHGVTTALSDFGRGQLTAAALDVVTKADVFDKVNVPQYVGELKSKRRYIPRYMPLVDAQDLTSSVLTGWRWTAGKTPTVGDWTMAATGTIPNEVLADIPTNEAVLETVTANAAYLAGGHQISRIHYDLPTPGFLESYIRESDDDFMRKLDAKVLTNLTTPANQTAVVSSGADATNVWTKLILGAHNVLEVDLPEWALIGPDLWRQALATTKLEALELLSSALGLEEGDLAKFRLVGAPASQTALNGTVIVGSKSCATLHTLPGGPTRVEAINVQKGSVDNGVYGYWGIINHTTKSLVKVT